MLGRADLDQLSPVLYEIPRTHRPDMRVPARLYADEPLLNMALRDRSLEQLANTATLPGIVGHALAMPDVHQGYGFPIGGVVATELPKGAISPGGVGYDINCGVRVLTSHIHASDLAPHLADLMDDLFRSVPVGVGASGDVRLSSSKLGDMLERGAAWAVGQGYGTAADLVRTEDNGRMEVARAASTSPRAMERGQDQVGTLGAGNHFIEIDQIDEVYDENVADAFGLIPGCICVWIHCGSRGLGHQVCTDAVRTMQKAVHKYGIAVPDRELACAPFESPEAQTYYQAMCCAANYAWANRQVITELVRRSLDRVLRGHIAHANLDMLYDVCHNIAKVEEHIVDGIPRRLCVHRKGATRAFGPGRSEVPADLRSIGQPVLIPGSMGTGSYILVGTSQAMRDTFGSACHGAGRTMSRSAARKSFRGEALRAELEQSSIAVRAGSMRLLAEEAPRAYKDVDRVVDVVQQAGIARAVARTRPLGVIKG